jgi:hypothetical protein
MELVKKYRKRVLGEFGLTWRPFEKKVTDIIISNRNGHFQSTDYFKKIKVRPTRTNGRYMIKKQSLRYVQFGYYMIAYRKTYFVHASAGIAFTRDRKCTDIFYSNNWKVVCGLAKLLASSNDELISIVDRKHAGKETYVLNKTQQLRSNKVIVN